MAGTLAIQKT
jgi:nuclear transport factor 2 (NTF2) superfamily protein